MESTLNNKLQDIRKMIKYKIRILPDEDNEDNYRENIKINTPICSGIKEGVSKKITFSRKTGSLFEETLYALESLKLVADELDQKVNNQNKMLSLQYGEEVRTNEIEAKIHQLEIKSRKPKDHHIFNYKEACLIF